MHLVTAYIQIRTVCFRRLSATVQEEGSPQTFARPAWGMSTVESTMQCCV